MCAGSSTGQEEKPGPQTLACSNASTLLSLLRSFEAQFHFRRALATIGGVLLVAGSFWATVSFLTSHSYLILVLAGVVCIAVSAVADPQGLLRHLPEEVQDFLLNRRIFDLIHDDSPVTNAVRKWGRVQLLAMQSGSSEGAVREIVQSMGPDFLNMVLCRSFLSFLPFPLQHVMLPPAVPTLVAPEEGVPKSGCARPAGCEWPLEDGRPGAPPISWILHFLQQRNEAKTKKVTEPELLPLIVPNVLTAFTAATRTCLRGLKVFAAAAGTGCLVSAAIYFRGWGSKVLLDSLAAGGLVVKAPTDEASHKASRLAAALGLLSAGGAIAVAMSWERFCRFPKDSGSLRRSDRLFEPEREASPPNSHVC